MSDMVKTGKAAVFLEGEKRFDIREYPVIAPMKSEVLIRMLRSGVCGTDAHICDGRLPLGRRELIIGHELIGEVADCEAEVTHDGLGAPIRCGDRVVACVAVPCGFCFNCHRGGTASCLSFGVTYLKDPAQVPHFHGGYAEYLHSPAVNLVRIPDGVDIDAVAAFPCGGPTIIRAFEYGGGLEKGELVVVQGTGSLGLFAIAWAVSKGCRVIAIGSEANPARLALAGELGAEQTLNFRGVSEEERFKIVKERAKKLGRGDGADVVVEATGSPRAVPEGMRLVRTRGRYLVPGQYSLSGKVEIQPELITFKAMRIIGSGQYMLSDVGTYLEFLKANPGCQAIFSRCVTHRFTVERAADAVAAAASGAAVKAVLVGN